MPRADRNARREYIREWSRKWAAKRKALGLCFYCSRRSVPGLIRCERCRRKHNKRKDDYIRKRRATFRTLGVCMHCGGKLSARSRNQCDSCLEKNRTRRQRWIRKPANRRLQQERGRSYRRKRREYHRAKCRQWNKDHREHVRRYRRKHDLMQKYGMTPEDKLRLYREQGNGCAVCVALGITAPVKSLVVDHDHRMRGLTKREQVRGLLCPAHNCAVGFCHDNPLEARAIADYLEKWNAKWRDQGRKRCRSTRTHQADSKNVKETSCLTATPPSPAL